MTPPDDKAEGASERLARDLVRACDNLTMDVQRATGITPSLLRAAAAALRALGRSDILSAPFRVLTSCPSCGKLHVDRGEWATRPHKTHLCVDDPHSAPERGCGARWRLSERPTVGVATLQDTVYLDDEPRGQALGRSESSYAAGWKQGQEKMREQAKGECLDQQRTFERARQFKRAAGAESCALVVGHVPFTAPPPAAEETTSAAGMRGKAARIEARVAGFIETEADLVAWRSAKAGVAGAERVVSALRSIALRVRAGEHREALYEEVSSPTPAATAPDTELDSPPFKPTALTEFESRGFERVNRHVAATATERGETCTCDPEYDHTSGCVLKYGYQLSKPEPQR